MVLRPEDFHDFVEEPMDYAPQPGEPDLTAHLMAPDSDSVGNFPIMLHAYMLNRFEHESPDYDVRQYQHQLREYKVGRFITEAIDAVYEKDRAEIIDPALVAPMRKDSSFARQNTHRTVIDEAVPHLPASISPDVFADPPYEDLEAA